MNFGYIKSKLDGSEQKFSSTLKTVPEQFSYIPDLPKVLDQGSEPICVPCSISAYIDWKERKDAKTNLKEIFANGGTDTGMSFKDALHFIKHNGVSTASGNFKIKQYAMVGSIPVLKSAIVMNGPCIAGLPVYNNTMEFWKETDALQGGHAVAIVGYDKDGFILRNSWGQYFGQKGYTHMSYKDFQNFYEIWTLI